MYLFSIKLWRGCIYRRQYLDDFRGLTAVPSPHSPPFRLNHVLANFRATLSHQVRVRYSRAAVEAHVQDCSNVWRDSNVLGPARSIELRLLYRDPLLWK